MNAFLRWLMLANARRVFLVSAVGLVLVGGWWTWRTTAPVDAHELRPSSPAPHTADVTLGLAAALERELNAAAIDTPGNPFVRSSIAWRWSRRTGRERERTDTPFDFAEASVPPPAETATPDTPPANPPTGEPGLVEATASPSSRERIELRYKGLFQLPDGSRHALLFDSKTQRTAFYPAGEIVEGITLRDVTPKMLTLELEDGTTVPIGIGETKAFEDGRYAY